MPQQSSQGAGPGPVRTAGRSVASVARAHAMTSKLALPSGTRLAGC